jgi:hypothetical protein
MFRRLLSSQSAQLIWLFVDLYKIELFKVKLKINSLFLASDVMVSLLSSRISVLSFHILRILWFYWRDSDFKDSFVRTSGCEGGGRIGRQPRAMLASHLHLYLCELPFFLMLLS